MDKTKMAIRVFDKNAKVYEDKFMDVNYPETFDFFISNVIKRDAEILDIACGPGNITKYLLDKRADYRILGLDLSPKMLELARANNPDANFMQLDCREIRSINKKFNGIMCGFGLPYLNREEAIVLIADSAELLFEQGILYLSTMEDKNTKSGLTKSSSGDELYINYHEAGYLTKALEMNGFEIVDLQRKAYPDNVEVIDLIIIAKLLKPALANLLTVIS